MKITIKEKHKSLNPPCNITLPDFVVLTGKNGSGKSHLLEALSDVRKSDVQINGKKAQNIKYIGFNGLNPNIVEICDPNTISGFAKQHWNSYVAARDNILREPNEQHSIRRIYDHNGDQTFRRYTDKVFAATKKEWHKLTEEDYAECFDGSLMSQGDFFTAQFALLFKSYHKRQEENNINEYYNAKGILPTRAFLPKEEFEKKYGTPPWDFVNKILIETNIPYEVNSPVGTRLDSSYKFSLKDRTHGFEIGSMDLSTGEKVLMSLALAIYNTNGDSGKPELLLLDEPDAGLHPSMSKKMVEVLNKNIVTENKIPTIITTHSPMTIIASEGLSIYQMTRGEGVPVRIPTQRAVEILTSEIPFLRISNDKRRQVFVESKYDVNYYELLTNIYSRITKLQSEPIYIPAKTSPGSNCSDVIGVVDGLYGNGNDQIYGIIDWDKSNISRGRIIVLGENERYAIENYLLDPLLMGLLFIRERKLEFSQIPLTAYSNYTDIGRLTLPDAQKLIDYVLSTLGLPLKDPCVYQLQNGWTLTVPMDFNHYQGHDLETLYKIKFPHLNSYQKESALKNDVIEKIINDYPGFAPRQLFEVIAKIQ